MRSPGPRLTYNNKKAPTSQQRRLRPSHYLGLFLLFCVVANIGLILTWFRKAHTPLISASDNNSPHTFDTQAKAILMKRRALPNDEKESIKHEQDLQEEEEQEHQVVDDKDTVPQDLTRGHSQKDVVTSDTPQQQKEGQPVSIVAHVVSLIKCSKSVTGFIDAAAVFRHSIHLQSHAAGVSKYGYQMYAIVHEQCQDPHAPLLEKLGYKVLVKPPPIRVEDIQPGWYRDHVENENCCGSAEFIKLYAYELEQHDIVVHWDMDVAILKPMDELFDAMIHDKDSPEGQAARSKLLLQHPSQKLPDRIDAFFTRDITSSQPWESVQGVQGGFLVARPSKRDLQQYIDFIKVGNYTKGRGDGTGWNALGYGGFQGAMAYQGVVAFFYDFYRPNTAVELDVCRWNQVVADVIWRGPVRMDLNGTCREHPKVGSDLVANTQCEDCRITPIDQIKTVHYTACKKPWECQVPHPRNPADKRQVYRLSHLTNITTCGLLFKKWFELRQDVERELQKVANVKPSNSDGDYSAEYFLGYCQGKSKYIPMEPPPDGFDMNKIYGM